MSARITNAAYLLSGLFFVPGALWMTSLFTGEGLGGLLSSASIIIIYYIPLLAIVSAIRPHFSLPLVAWPFLGILVLELLAFFPALDPLSIMGYGLESLRPNANPAVLGKSALLILGAAIGGVSLLHKITLFRLVATVMAFAQCTAVVLFHIVVLSGPFTGLKAAERNMVVSAIEIDGSMSRLCDLSGRYCMRGSLDEAREWASLTLRTPKQTISLIDDTSDRSRLFHIWVENPSPDALEKVAIVSALKHSSDDIEIMVNEAGPTLVYAKLRTSLGLLVAIFHGAWIAIGLSILARHKNYIYKRGRWQRSPN
jgi:hypothetical protein